MKRLIIFLIRKKLDLKKYEYFVFTNQKTNGIYFFTEERLMKIEPKNPNSDKNRIYLYIPKKIEFNTYENFNCREANVSLNWLLNEECTIEHLVGDIKWL